MLKRSLSAETAPPPPTPPPPPQKKSFVCAQWCLIKAVNNYSIIVFRMRHKVVMQYISFWVRSACHWTPHHINYSAKQIHIWANIEREYTVGLAARRLHSHNWFIIDAFFLIVSHLFMLALLHKGIYCHAFITYIYSHDHADYIGFNATDELWQTDKARQIERETEPRERWRERKGREVWGSRRMRLKNRQKFRQVIISSTAKC